MARARNIKPAFFKNELLGELSAETRLLFIGLWTLADREGRLEDRPRRIKMELFAYDSFDIDSMLNDLQSSKFLVRYTVDETKYIQITNFVKHQDPHYREKASEIPPMPGAVNAVVATNITRTQRARILERDNYTCQSCGSKDHPCIDHIIPVSRGGDSSDDNLQVLCLPCNTKKGNKIDSTSNQRRADVESKDAQAVPLNPDSLIPESLNLKPEPLTTTDANAPAAGGGGDASPERDSPKAAPLPARQELPEPTNPALALTVALRPLGVSALSTHPTVIAWAAKGVTLAILTEAVRIAREHKGNETLSPNYLAPIVERLVNPPPGAKPSGRTAPGLSQKFHFEGVDRSGDVAAMQAGLERMGVTAADLDDDSPL